MNILFPVVLDLELEVQQKRRGPISNVVCITAAISFTLPQSSLSTISVASAWPVNVLVFTRLYDFLIFKFPSFKFNGNLFTVSLYSLRFVCCLRKILLSLTLWSSNSSEVPPHEYLDRSCRRLKPCINNGHRSFSSNSECICPEPYFGEQCEKYCDQGQRMRG